MGKVLHASGSGYFPSCIQTAPDTKSNLVGGTLEEIMELYWRVKSWRLDYVSGSENFYFGSSVETLTYTASQQALGSVVATSEESLVCNPYTLLSANAEYLLTFSGGSSSLSLGILLNSYFLKENETYYMEFLFDMLFVTTQETGYEVGSLTINGLSVPLYGYIDGNQPDNIDGNISVSISATEYWSYGGTYDTSTGLPL